MMPYVHSALWIAVFALAALVAWLMAERFDWRPVVHLPGGRRPFRAVTPTIWPAPQSPRSSGNLAFDSWRDSELTRLERDRRALEAKLQAFEAFVAKLRFAKDRETFERFLAAHPEAVAASGGEVVVEAPDHAVEPVHGG